MTIKCPECGKEISDKSKQCIHCGFSFDKATAPKDNKATAVFVLGVCGLVVGIFGLISAIIGACLGKSYTKGLGYAGKILSWIAIGLYTFVILCVLLCVLLDLFF